MPNKSGDTALVMSRGALVVSEDGLAVLRPPSMEAWAEAGPVICGNKDGLQFALGDWVAYGRSQQSWDDGLVETAIEATGYDWGTLREYEAVARRFPRDFRQEILRDAGRKLRWRHWQIVKGRNDDEAKALLQRAIAESMRTDDFRALVSGLRGTRLGPMKLFPDGRFGLVYTGVLAQPPPVDLTLETVCGLADRIAGVMGPSSVAVVRSWPSRLPDALAVLRAWGYEHVGHFVVPCAARSTTWFEEVHEVVLLGTRGRPTPPTFRLRSAGRSDVALEDLDASFPGLPKIALYANWERDGWTTWGSEVLAVPAQPTISEERAIRVRA